MYSTEEQIHIMHLYHPNPNQSLRNVRNIFSVTYLDRPISSIGTIFLNDMSIFNISTIFDRFDCITNTGNHGS
jgi:hypothetical protein